MNPRTAQVERTTKETSVSVTLTLDGVGQSEIDTGLGFLDHMLTALAFHARFDFVVRCKGDLVIDDHHTSEDCAIAIGSAMGLALGERTGICRFGYAYAPLDESLARCVVDLAARPTCVVELGLKREKLGEWACENITHFFRTLAHEARLCLHVDVLRGDNDHHRVESAFKSLALALRSAVKRDSSIQSPSTKGAM